MFWFCSIVKYVTDADNSAQSLIHVCQLGTKTIRFGNFVGKQFDREERGAVRNLHLLGSSFLWNSCPKQCCRRKWCRHIVLLGGKCYGYVPQNLNHWRGNSSSKFEENLLERDQQQRIRLKRK